MAGKLATLGQASLWIALAGCGALLPGPAGSPEGGDYCIEKVGRPKACYQTPDERSRAQDDADRAEVAAQLEKDHREQDARWARAQAEQKAQAESRFAEKMDALAERNAAKQSFADAEAAQRAEIHQRASDRAYAVPAISAIMCSIQDEIVGLKADLAHEKRVTAIGGVVNLSARDEAANDIVDDTDELKTWGQALKRFGATQQACKEVAAIVACRHKVESCDEASRGAAEVWDKEQATLWGSDKERPNR